jgi:translation initiation factor 2B subunit (eIF-2B alpha/beta/delta family)
MNSIRSKLTIILDENVHQLYDALKLCNYRVIKLTKGISDSDMADIADGCAILTKNVDDFIDNAYRCDYDIISVKSVKFIDDDKTLNNDTVKKIKKAIRDSGFCSMKGTFLLDIRDDGSHQLTQIF